MAKVSTGSRRSRRMFAKGQKTTSKRRKRLPRRIIDPDCSICQEPLGHVAETTRLPCRHTFHSDCINSWMQRHMTCPDCRADIPARFRPPSESDTEPDPCPICYEPLEGETTQLPCRHTFHTECIQDWMQRHMTCPICRAHIPANLGPPPDSESDSDGEPELAFTSDRATHPPVPPFVRGRIINNVFRRRGTGGIAVFRDSHGRLYEGAP